MEESHELPKKEVPTWLLNSYTCLRIPMYICIQYIYVCILYIYVWSKPLYIEYINGHAIVT